MNSVMWFRRDLRLHDNPALAAADSHGEKTACMVMIDSALWPTWGAAKQAYLVDSLSSLDASLDGKLIVRHGDPIEEVLSVAKAANATKVFCAADFTTPGIERDQKVKDVLAANGIEFEIVGSNYAVAPGRVNKPDGTPYKVYTPFYKNWLVHGWRAPLEMNLSRNWISDVESDGLPVVQMPAGMERSVAGEAAALERFDAFLKTGVKSYKDLRDRADVDGTSRLSVALKWGEIHPRTILAELGESEGEETFRKEIAWREFYADVLFHNPHTVTEYLNPAFANMEYNSGELADQHFDAWKQGKTGYPFVDAGMRQLLQEGWMHNRVRMVVASFFVKDLHLEWQQGAAWFFELLKDADVASNQHGWQWTAGCGTDASPYFRIFNPITQGLKFDPNGKYVRKYIPELRHIDGAAVHEPWDQGDGYANGYAKRIVDHATELDESLRRYSEIKK
ncbi:MAG: deoxyribodipyrimidine photo-lyase [Actinobacteria bacterium]|nr:deoxyribodipyrimidine photo-lyase [Actinomycetota bacterium]